MIDISGLNIDELREIIKDAQTLIVSKKEQRLIDAYIEFERIAKENEYKIEDIIKAGKSLTVEREIKYRNTSNKDEVWTGRGRKPNWLIDELLSGRDISEFRV